MNMSITFYEVEHHEDLQHCLNDLRSAGATVLKSHVNTDEEEAQVLVSFTDKKVFLDAFSKTTSYPFSSLS